MKSLLIQVTPADIAGSQQYGIHDPILFALQRVTGTLWHMAPGGVAFEIMPPARVLFLRGSTLELWHAFHRTHRMEPFEFVAQFKTPRQPDFLRLDPQRLADESRAQW